MKLTILGESMLVFELRMSGALCASPEVRVAICNIIAGGSGALFSPTSSIARSLLEKGLSSSPLPIADQAKQFCNFMQRNVTATFDLGDKLSQAKDMQEALKVQSEFFQDQMRTMTDQARSMGESAMKAASGVFIPKN